MIAEQYSLEHGYIGNIGKLIDDLGPSGHLVKL
jgi:hypothetical protein